MIASVLFGLTILSYVLALIAGRNADD